MVIFHNRQEAGQELAQRLSFYKAAKETLVIALPRGGVIVGYEIAKELDLPLDIVTPRKIGHPHNPEFAIGAVTETGAYFLSTVIDELGISEEDLKGAIDREKKEAQKRLSRFRQDLLPRHLLKKNIILVDDGLATGFTMKAAVQTLRAENVNEIILAVPVSPPETLVQFSFLVDKTVCLLSPSNFQAVGQFYVDFEQVSDDEVISLLQKRALSFSSNFYGKHNTPQEDS